ncbi:MAG: hypothetical protein PVI41_12305 [Roseobacter sp.]|jgi:hypothetical protein
MPKSDCSDTALNRLVRRLAAQVRTVRKHRNGGQSKVIVEQVTFNAAGQAIFGKIDKS